MEGCPPIPKESILLETKRVSHRTISHRRLPQRRVSHKRRSQKSLSYRKSSIQKGIFHRGFSNKTYSREDFLIETCPITHQHVPSSTVLHMHHVAGTKCFICGRMRYCALQPPSPSPPTACISDEGSILHYQARRLGRIAFESGDLFA